MPLIKKRSWIFFLNKYPASPIIRLFIILALALPDSEHLGAAFGTCPLSCWLPILHRDGLWILHFPFGTALHTICFH